MKKSILMTMVAGMASLATMAQKPCSIQGTLTDDIKANKVYIVLSNNDLSFDSDNIDSAEVKKGKFSYTTKFKDVRRALIIPVMDEAKSVSMNQTQLLLVPGESAQVEIRKKGATIGGSTFYKQWGGAYNNINEATENVQAFVQKANQEAQGKSEQELDALRAKFNQMLKERDEAIASYGEKHMSEEGCVVYYAMQVGPAAKYYDMMTEEVRKGALGKLVKKLADDQNARDEARSKEEAKAKGAVEKTAEGKMFVDFEAEYEGKVQKLSDYVGKGKYVLVDFWASWCGPCKAEIPNLIEVYNKYKSDKFTVLGVATWDKPKDTLKSIEQLGIPYPQIMNAQEAGSDAYGILGIPQIILFGPDGTILKRNLRGQMIEKTLSELLDK